MSSDDSTDRDFSRRTFMKASGTLAAAGLLGAGAAGSAAAETEFDALDDRLLNWRAAEAKKVWDRGYRGRPDRTLALTDSGVSARHADLGPWNDLRIKPSEKGLANGVKMLEPESEDPDVDSEVSFTEFSGTMPSEIDSLSPEMPKTVAWYSETDRYGSFPIPRDNNGHGTHCAGIMTATGRASTIDPERTEHYEENTTLLPDDFLEYEVTAKAGTSVFASALGEGVFVEIVYDEEVLDASTFRFDSNITDTPTVHEEGEATYTIRVRPVETEAVVTDVPPEQPQEGTPLAGRLDEIAVGAYKHPAETMGERAEDGDTAVQSGVAPNFSLAGLQGLSGPTEDLGPMAGDLTERLNLRAVNMSWGSLLGAPLNAFGLLPASAGSIRTAADEGILTVAAAGNSWTPANGNAEPAGVGETISVVATDPFDGITGYSSGGIGNVNESQDGFDFKPDVTAPGGDVKPDALVGISANLAEAVVNIGTDIAGLPSVTLPGVDTPTPDVYSLVRATKNADPTADVTDPAAASADTTDVPRDHTEKGGTSMASPYVCGVAGLVAQAMEEDAPEQIALPTPADSGFEDTMRLKQVILATASTTAFTAAPYHNAQLAPSPAVYTHAERDPYEGYGRVNPDAAVDAVTRDLLADAESVSYDETLGLDVPFDSRAVAGYVEGTGKTLEASVSFERYSGANRGMAADDAHIDLFVYDAENPATPGEPNVVTSAVGVGGSPSVSVDTEDGKIYYVVAKLVNVPGVVNGFDVQTHFGFEVALPGSASGGDGRSESEADGLASGLR
jgi:hypothetical protein